MLLAGVEFVAEKVPAGFTTQGLRSLCDEEQAGVGFMPASRCSVQVCVACVCVCVCVCAYV